MSKEIKPYNAGDRLKLGTSVGVVNSSDSNCTYITWDEEITPDLDPCQSTSFLREKATLEVTYYKIPILPIDPEADKMVDQLIASKSRPIRSIKKEREDIVAYLRKFGVRDYIIEGIEQEAHVGSAAAIDFIPKTYKLIPETYKSILGFIEKWASEAIITEDHKAVIINHLDKLFTIIPNLFMPSIGINEDGVIGFTWENSDNHVNIQIAANGYLEFFHEDLVTGLAYGEDITLESGLSTLASDRLRRFL